MTVTRGIRSEYTAEEVEFLHSMGYRPLAVAEHLGIDPGSVARALTRAGRADLAGPYWTAQSTLRRRRAGVQPRRRVSVS